MFRNSILTKTALIALGAFTLQACASLSLNSRTEQLAAAGAAVGALTGVATGDDATERRQHGTIGAAGGAIIGAAIGQYFDQQQQQLQQNLQGTGISVSRPNETTISLNLPGDVTFATDSANVSPQFYGTLDQVAGVLSQYQDTRVIILGHTDNSGSYEYNQTLSENRARSVAQYLYQRGVNAGRIATAGRSFSEPVADNFSEQGKAANRRVDIMIQPLNPA